MKLTIKFLLMLLIVANCSNSDKNLLTGAGIIEGTEIIVRSKANGQLQNLYVKEGSQLKTDEKIAQIEIDKLQISKQQTMAGLEELNFHMLNAKNSIVQAKENYVTIQKQYNRIKNLFQNNSATQQQFDEIDIKYKTADTQLKIAQNSLNALEMKKKQLESGLQLIESQIDDASIKSPCDGIVVDKFIEQGELVNTGMPIVAIADLSNLWIKMYVTELELGFVKLNSTADVFIDSYPDQPFTGQIIWISPKAEFTPKNVQTKEARADLVYAVKIEIKNPEGKLKIGMPADIKVKKL